MLVRIADIVPESYVDGADIRYAIFMQGCLHDCFECQNPETHNLHGGHLVDTEDIISQFKRNRLLNGITLTGGDPFYQEAAAAELAEAAQNVGLNVWCYTGFNYEDVADAYLLNFVDVLVDGKFILDQRDLTLAFRGSANQRIIDIPESRRLNTIILWTGYND